MEKDNKESKIPKRRNRSVPKLKLVDNGVIGQIAKARVSLDERLTSLMIPTSSATPNEVLRKAVHLLENVCLVQHTGGKVFLQHANGDFERVVIL